MGVVHIVGVRLDRLLPEVERVLGGVADGNDVADRIVDVIERLEGRRAAARVFVDGAERLEPERLIVVRKRGSRP